MSVWEEGRWVCGILVWAWDGCKGFDAVRTFLKTIQCWYSPAVNSVGGILLI